METEKVVDHKLEILYFGGFANDLLRTLATKMNFSNILLVGVDGCGKRTRIHHFISNLLRTSNLHLFAEEFIIREDSVKSSRKHLGDTQEDESTAPFQMEEENKKGKKGRAKERNGPLQSLGENSEQDVKKGPRSIHTIQSLCHVEINAETWGT